MMNRPLAHDALLPAQPAVGEGAPMLRVEDARLLRGEGRFVDDVLPEGCLHLVFVRPYEQAGRIAALDCAAARGAPGVVAVFTGEDVAACAEAPVNPLLAREGSAPFELLSRAMHRAPGQAIAAVVATSRQAANDAAELVNYRITAGSPPDRAGFSGEWIIGASGEAPSGERMVELAVRHALLAPMALEPRATLAMRKGDRLQVLASTQTPHRMQADLGEILGFEPAHIDVVAPDVGGAFGGKASIAPEDAMVAFAALRLGAPVKWSATRSEEFLAAPRGRGGQSTARLTLAPNGKFQMLEAEFAFPLGHWLPYSAAVPARNAARILPGPYAIPHLRIRTRADAEPQAAVNIYRGAGRPEAAMLLERLVEAAAAETGIDPLALRLKNLPRRGQRMRTVAGDVIDRGDYRALLEAVRHAAQYENLRRKQRARRRRGEVVGIGLALYIEPCGQGWESARVGLDAEGRIIAATGSSAQGQGRETAYAAIVAEALGVPPAMIAVWHGDTGKTPPGIGALASRSTAIGGSAMRMAAEKLLDRVKARAAARFGCSADMLHASASGLTPEGSAHGASWAELARDAGPPGPDGLVLATDAIFTARHEAWASGAVLAMVSISRDTGELAVEELVWADDAGRVVNPMLVKGQLQGGMAQGFGEAIMEALRFSEGGELLTGSLQDYAVPRALDVPKVELIACSVPSVANPLGAKGVGEAGTIGVPAALVNAAIDALRPFGVTTLDMPLTSEKLWRAMQDGAAALHPNQKVRDA